MATMMLVAFQQQPVPCFEVYTDYTIVNQYQFHNIVHMGV